MKRPLEVTIINQSDIVPLQFPPKCQGQAQTSATNAAASEKAAEQAAESAQEYLKELKSYPKVKNHVISFGE